MSGADPSGLDWADRAAVTAAVLDALSTRAAPSAELFWQGEAPCAGSLDVFFPDDESHVPEQAATACAACPWRLACLVADAAPPGGQRNGILAGMTPADRDAIFTEITGTARAALSAPAVRVALAALVLRRGGIGDPWGQAARAAGLSPRSGYRYRIRVTDEVAAAAAAGTRARYLAATGLPGWAFDELALDAGAEESAAG